MTSSHKPLADQIPGSIRHCHAGCLIPLSFFPPFSFHTHFFSPKVLSRFFLHANAYLFDFFRGPDVIVLAIPFSPSVAS
jgi:hypothetical protein